MEKIQEIKNLLPGVKVGTADSWNKYADGTADAVIQGADILWVSLSSSPEFC
jgi:glucan 1,3-beta-glucosidase